VPYAIGGALAYGLWAIPRATADVDVNVFVDDSALDRVLDALESVDIEVDRPRCIREAAARGMFVLQMGLYRIDVFTPSIDFSWEAERTRVEHIIDGDRIWFLSAEAIAIFKMLFFRPKDIVDLQRLIAVQAERLNRGYVRDWLVRMMGESDERVGKWDELVGAA
jgi:hypothetical protein